MSIVIYHDYEEFSYTEKDICDFLEDQSVIKEDSYGDYDEDSIENDLFEFNDDKIDLRNDASYYILCNDEDDELAEDIANYLGKNTKIVLNNFDKIFFYVI